MLSLRTLGFLGLSGPDGEDITPILSQPKRFALLVYLALADPGGLFRRDSLLTLFWPEVPEKRARNALSQSLSFLRQHLPEQTIVSRGVEEVGLGGTAFKADVSEFEELAAGGEWGEALDRYSGDFLTGFHIPGAPGLDEWMRMERDRLRDLAANCAWALARDQVRRGALVEGERSSKRALGLACPDETTVQRFMEVLAAAGDRVAALRLFENYSRLLCENLDLEPTGELRELEGRLRSMGEGGSSEAGYVPEEAEMAPLTSPVWGVRPPVEDGLKFAGRGVELARLGHFLDRALAGHGTVAFISGEAGSGKSTLAREFATRSMTTHPDLISATGYCNSHTGVGDPYHPFRETLRLLTGDVESQWMAGSMSADHAKRLWSLLPFATEALVNLGPDLLGTLIRTPALASRAAAFGPEGAQWEPKLTGHPSSSHKNPEGSVQATLFDQFARVLRQISKERPLLLILEDLQWADGGSLDLLFHLGRQLEGTRILVLGLFRPSEISLGRKGERHPLAKVFREFQTAIGDIEVTLDERDDRVFFDAMLDSEPNVLSREFREALFRITRGHALFTIEFLRALQDEGRIRPDKKGRWVVDPDLEWDRLPARVEAVIEERTDRLPEDLKALLRVASVEGDYFTMEVTAEVLGQDPMELIPLLARDLEKRHRLVRMDGVEKVGDQRLSIYRFRHILFQEFLYSRMDKAEKAYTHERIGRALESLYGERADRKALALARHYGESGRPRKASEYLVIAAEKAKARAAYREAVNLLREAESRLATMPESEDRSRRELAVLSKRLPISWSLGLFDAGGGEDIKRLKYLAGRFDDEDSLCWAHFCEVFQHHFAGQHEKGRAALDRAQVIVDRTEDMSQRVQLHGLRGLNALNLGLPSVALEHLDRFESLYDPKRDEEFLTRWVPAPRPVFRALRALGLGPLGFPEKAEECLQEAYALLQKRSDSASLLWVVDYDLLLRWIIGDVEGCCRVNEPYLKAAEGARHQGWSAIGYFSQGWCEAKAGDLGKGAETMRSSLVEMDRIGWTLWRPYLNALLAGPLHRLGRKAEAIRLVDSGLDQISRTGERGQESEVHRARGEVLFSGPDSDPVASEASFRTAIRISQKQNAKLYELRALVSLGRLLIDQGREREARKGLKKCYGWFTEGFEFPDLKDAKALLEELG